MPYSRAVVFTWVALVVTAIALGVGLGLGIGQSTSTDRDNDVSSLSLARLMPTSTPSALPSQSPSDMPSVEPSVAPSDMPSVEPSVAPTDMPSWQPSMLPSVSPTVEPSMFPTYYVPSDYTFRLKMHWEDDYCWQGDCEEKEWCLECVRCDPITASSTGDGCYDYNGRDNEYCQEGDQMWLQSCGSDKGNARFQLIQHASGGDQIKTREYDLCMTRVESKYIQLLDCDEDEDRQRWYGFQPYGEPFELLPAEKLYRCLTQWHHPKREEIVYAGTCETAQEDDTSMWEAIY